MAGRGGAGLGPVLGMGFAWDSAAWRDQLLVKPPHNYAPHSESQTLVCAGCPPSCRTFRPCTSERSPAGCSASQALASTSLPSRSCAGCGPPAPPELHAGGQGQPAG